MQLSREYVRSQQRHLVRQWHTWVQGRGRFDPEGSALGEQRGYRVLLRFRHAAAEISRSAVLVVSGGARALAFLAAAARPLRRVRSGEQLRQRGTRRRRYRHRVLRHSSRLRSWLSSRCRRSRKKKKKTSLANRVAGKAFAISRYTCLFLVPSESEPF